MKPVCCFGAYDRGYPRNRILREGLGACGRARALEVATPECIGADLRAVLEGLEGAP